MTQESLRPYEAVIIMHPDTSADDLKTALKKNKTVIQDFGGNVFSLDTWGKRHLANPIGKLKKAHYFHAIFEAKPQTIHELERVMGINDKVLRFMHTRLDERLSVAKHAENFKKGLQETLAREKEREAKIQMKKAAAAERHESRE
jgi:small subunit ribosomal protein S6